MNAYPTGLPDPRLNARNLFTTQPTQQQPPQPVVTVKPSNIPSRGWRELRKPMTLEDMKAREYPANAPVINEMLSYTPKVVKLEEKISTDRLIDEAEQKHQNMIDQFFNSICNPPQSLPLPDDPVITPIEQVSIHQDPVSNGIGPILACKEMSSVPEFNQDPGAAPMHMKTMSRA